MKSRVLLIGVSALTVVGVSACGSSGGSGASPVTTIKMSAPDYITAVPILTSTVPSTTQVAQPGDPTATVAGEQEYTVLSGDILVRIAKKYGVTAQGIADYNTWADGVTHLIYPGLKIKIPPGATPPVAGGSTGGSTTATTAPRATPTQTTTTVNASAGGTYVVVDGDTLSRIATKNGTTVAAIVAVNGWADANHLIYKGLKIKLPTKTG